MTDFEYTEKNLYDLLLILCDMLSSENISSHEEILCEFIKKTELEGKPLRPSLKLMNKYTRLRATLEYTSCNLSYNSQKKILDIMEEMWPEDSEVIQQLQHAAENMHSSYKNGNLKPTMSSKEFIRTLLSKK